MSNGPNTEAPLRFTSLERDFLSKLGFGYPAKKDLPIWQGTQGVVPPPEIRKAWRVWLERGWSMRRGVRIIGCSENYVRRLRDELEGNRDDLEDVLSVLGDDPKTYEELDERGRRGVDDFLFFSSEFLGLQTPPFWDEMGRILSAPADLGPGEVYQVLINIHPGVGKTSCFLAFMTWRIVRARALGLTDFSCAYGSRSDRLAQRGMRQVKQWLSASRVVEVYGRFAPQRKQQGNRPGEETNIWRVDEISVVGLGSGKESTFSVWASHAAIKGIRPHLMLWDDPIGKRDITPDKTQTMLDWWDQDAAPRVEPGGVLAVAGNYLSPTDFYHVLKDRSYTFEQPDGSVTEERAWVHVKFPAHDLNKCPGNGEHPAYPDGCLLWPERFSFRALEKRRQDREDVFEIQYQQTETPVAEILVPKIWVEGGSGGDGEVYPGCLDFEREMWQKVERSDQAIIVGTIDPSPSRYASCQLWMHDPPFHHLLAHQRARMRTPEYAQLVYEWTNRARETYGGSFDTWIIERTGARYLTETDEFDQLQALLGIWYIHHETQANKNDESFGLWSFRNEFRYGRVRIPWAPGPTREAMRIFVDEHTQYPWYETDDTVLAHWFYHLHKHKVLAPGTDEIEMARPSWLKEKEEAGWFG